MVQMDTSVSCNLVQHLHHLPHYTLYSLAVYQVHPVWC